MKKIVRPIGLLITFMFVVYFCNNPVITGSWASPEVEKNYDHLMVAVLVGVESLKLNIERNVEQSLQDKGVDVSQISDTLPNELIKDETMQQQILEKIKNEGTDAILTVSFIDFDSGERYIPNRVGYGKPTYDYYGTFWRYYSHWFPHVYSEDFYLGGESFIIETNLYDTETEELIWSGQSRPYEPEAIETFSKKFADELADRLENNNII